MLELKNISVEAEGKPVVMDVTLSVKSSDVAVLMGPNGSGKSTLVNAVMGHPHYRVTKGKVVLDGADITKLPTHEKATNGLFLSLQHTPKVGGINLATFLHKVHVARTGEESDILEYYLELRELAKTLSIPEALLDRPLTAGLSGGERKLSEILQLAVLKPKYAILDEIDSGVDVDAMKTVYAALDTVKKSGTGMLVISHHPSLLEHLRPDQVHVMNAGVLAKSGGPELATDVIKNGFCKVLECPVVETCRARKRS